MRRARRAAASRVAATKAASTSSVPEMRALLVRAWSISYSVFSKLSMFVPAGPMGQYSDVHGAGLWLCNTDVLAETTGYECPTDGGPPTTCFSELHSRVSLPRELHTHTHIHHPHVKKKHALTVAFPRVFRPLHLSAPPLALCVQAVVWSFACVVHSTARKCKICTVHISMPLV